MIICRLLGQTPTYMNTEIIFTHCHKNVKRTKYDKRQGHKTKVTKEGQKVANDKCYKMSKRQNVTKDIVTQTKYHKMS